MYKILNARLMPILGTYRVMIQAPDESITAFELSTLTWHELTHSDFCAIGAAIDTDGCSGALQVYLHACYLHDLHYRCHQDLDGSQITRAEADRRLRELTKRESLFDGISPMAHWRWLALRIFGGSAWDHETKGTPLAENPTLYAWRCHDEAS